MPQVPMPQVDALRETMSDAVRDMKVNLGNVGTSDFLSAEQIWGVALASIYYIGDLKLREALLADAQAAGVTPELLDDARAAAGLMGMNTVYYRFRHMVGKESYSTKPARLRMNWIARPLGSKVDFELFCLAVSAINGCEMCIRSHEEVVIKGGLSEDQVHDAVRVAATIQATAVSLEMAALTDEVQTQTATV